MRLICILNLPLIPRGLSQKIRFTACLLPDKSVNMLITGIKRGRYCDTTPPFQFFTWQLMWRSPMKNNFCCSHDLGETAQLTFYKLHIYKFYSSIIRTCV